MDYIFEEWEKKLSTFESSVEKDLAEIRKCKAEMQQMKLDVVAELQKGRYVRDSQRLVLSAPEIIIGNVDRSGTLFAGGSTVIVRGTQVGVEGAGEGGRLDLRAPSIREIAEDRGDSRCCAPSRKRPWRSRPAGLVSGGQHVPWETRRKTPYR